ncbi:hypothetical protein [Streptomyces sp. NPDC046988]|uniref:hypothetical protein n=1 Tax=Streptomyces sp. NPDC046988 TaxID=3154922 RepID=UPI003400464B
MAEVGRGDEQGDVHGVDGARRARELLHVRAGFGPAAGPVLALAGHGASVGGGVSFQGGEALVVPAQLALDVLDVRAEFDELAAVFAGRGDEGVEHRYDGAAEDVGDALVDAGVEGFTRSSTRVNES